MTRPSDSRRRPGRTEMLIGALTLLTAVSMLALDGTRDGDLYLQLASGRFISSHGIVAVDPFNTIAHGKPWLNQQWLAELIAYQISAWVGVTGLTALYAALLAAPLALLLWLCRRKGTAMLIALAALYGPGLWVIVHPRAAGFSLLFFTVLITILASVWLRRPQPPCRGRTGWAAPGIVAIFAVWANLHGGFIAGLVLIGLAVCGLSVERRFGLQPATAVPRIALLALVGALASIAVLLATPLGTSIIDYLTSFTNPSISLVSSEWSPAVRFPLALAYLAVAALFAAWLWIRAPRPRPATTALILVVFLGLALASLRNIVFVGPALALAIASLAPDRETSAPGGVPALALLSSATVVAIWALGVGPARNEPILGRRLIGFALRHPPRDKHIASYAGVGSYMLWRSPSAPVAVDGWLEHFSAAQLRDTYAVVDGSAREPMRYVRRLRIGAVIADRRRAVDDLLRHGFEIRFRTRAGAYLVLPTASSRSSR